MGLNQTVSGVPQGTDFEVVLASTHTLCFEAKLRKIMYTLVNPSFSV